MDFVGKLQVIIDQWPIIDFVEYAVEMMMAISCVLFWP